MPNFFKEKSGFGVKIAQILIFLISRQKLLLWKLHGESLEYL